MPTNIVIVHAYSRKRSKVFKISKLLNLAINFPIISLVSQAPLGCPCEVELHECLQRRDTNSPGCRKGGASDLNL